ncbi:hypothetical protein HWE01_19365 [Herbaspirillum sp. C7C8]|uniref:hypothetical protein n=1 Tax=Herbaspirillum sp. GW103 TaxID=1175306 RepID=UPI0012F670AC|nr:hypothetical protein [Herbaspirillum sp. GW103]MCI1006978.1 hypothetical protein [Herbaspirillum sp. C7C8]
MSFVVMFEGDLGRLQPGQPNNISELDRPASGIPLRIAAVSNEDEELIDNFRETADVPGITLHRLTSECFTHMTFAALLAVQQQEAARRYNGMTKRRRETSLSGAGVRARARKTGARTIRHPWNLSMRSSSKPGIDGRHAVSSAAARAVVAAELCNVRQLET